MKNKYKLTTQLLYPLLLCLLLSHCTDNYNSSSKVEETMLDDLLQKGLELIELDEIDSALFYLEQTLELEGALQTKAICYNNLGYCYRLKQNFELELESFVESERLFFLDKDTVNHARSQVNLAACLSRLDVYKRAIKYGLEAELILVDEFGHEEDLVVLYNTLGILYCDIGNYLTAKHYHKKSLQLRQQLSPKVSIAPAINNLGNCFFEQGQYDSAMAYFTHYRMLAVQLEDDKRMGIAYGNIAKTHLKQGNVEYCEAFLDSAQEKYTKINYCEGQTFLHNVRSDFYFVKNNMKLAAQEAQAAIALSDSILMPSEKLYALENLKSIYTHQQHYEQASAITEQYQALKDSIFGEEGDVVLKE